MASCPELLNSSVSIVEKQGGDAYACLSPDVVHLSGVRRSAIYDLGRRRIYWLDEAARKIVNELTSGTSISALMWNEDMHDVWAFLQDRELIRLEPAPRGQLLTSTDAPGRSPAMAWLELGTLCNHRCVHCYNGSGPSPEATSEPDRLLLLRAVDELAAAGTKTLKIIGGEPLVHFGLVEELLLRARSVGIASYGVHTNGTLLTRTRAAALAAIGASADITVYGHTAELHEAVTKTAHSFERTLGGLRNCLATGLAASANLIVVPSNESWVEDIRHWYARNFPGLPFGYDYTRPVGRGVALYRQLSLAHLNRYREHVTGFPGIGLEDYHVRTTSNPCLHDKVMITADGGVTPCIMQRNECGNLADSSLNTILKGASYSAFADLSLAKVEVCCDCEFRLACTDCRPVAEGLTGSRTAKPPECPYDPYSGQVCVEERDIG